ncbi:hypothetical protein LCGC14_0563990 [marine sediment metagenome]|uniref:Probable sensor domain-containing protein n=1 Tax=marine sediment metagenome TaxID=412755 RepID=A0A0F9U7Q6_9ZZZZ
MKEYKFPQNLTEYIQKKWENFIGGDYKPPPLPNEQILKYILEVAYLVGMEKEENRSLKFCLCCTPTIDSISKQHYPKELIETWKIKPSREFNVQEIRRICIGTNIINSAIWIRFSEKDKNEVEIYGLINLGPQWEQTKRAFSYRIESNPNALIIRVENQNQIRIYQGNYLLVSLESGILQEPIPFFMNIMFDQLVNEGLSYFSEEIFNPVLDPIKEFKEFEFIAYKNVLVAILNRIQMNRHGGTLILSGKENDFLLSKEKIIRTKYDLSDNSAYLRTNFINFINSRHQFADLNYKFEKGELTINDVKLKEFEYSITLEKLRNTCLFTGDLANADGALIIKNDFTIMGFGTEIIMDKLKQIKVYQINDLHDYLGKEKKEFDSEQRGMRHRSAMRLCAAFSDITAFVVSQDGTISIISQNREGDVCIQSNIRFTNMNMVFA